MNDISLHDLKKMDKRNLMNLYLSLQEFTKNTLKENSEMKEIIEMRRKLDFAASSEKVVDRIGYQPARRYIERHHYPQSQCNACEAELADGEKNIIVADYHAQVDGLMAAPSMVAQSAVQKFADGLPLYRQSGIYKREGLEISRQTLSNWLLRYWQLLTPLSKRLREHIVQAHLINQDETPIKVLNPSPLASSRNNFMVVQVGTSGAHKRELCNRGYIYIRIFLLISSDLCLGFSRIIQRSISLSGLFVSLAGSQIIIF